MRAPPSASDGRIFTVTIDNQLVVYASDDGRRLWSNTGVEEAAGFLGGRTPPCSAMWWSRPTPPAISWPSTW
jgi:hypothetical protein